MVSYDKLYLWFVYCCFFIPDADICMVNCDKFYEQVKSKRKYMNTFAVSNFSFT